jgi:protein-disulfide isomerase-like protein with CxxC motif
LPQLPPPSEARISQLLQVAGDLAHDGLDALIQTITRGGWVGGEGIDVFEAVTNILKDRGVDTQRVEAAFPEFERRAETLLGAYDTYRLVYERTSKDVPEARAAIRDDARQRVIQAKNDLLEQYQADILRLLRVAQEQGV